MSNATCSPGDTGASNSDSKYLLFFGLGIDCMRI